MDEQSPWKGEGPGRLIVASGVFVALVALTFVIVTGFAVADGDLVGALGSAAVAVYFGNLVGLGSALWWRPRQIPSPSAVLVEDGGLSFRYSAWAYFWVASNLVLHTIALLLFGAFLMSEGDTTSVVVAIVCFAGVIWLALFTVRLLPGAPGRLRLTPSGLEQRGLGILHRLPWDHVTDVAPATINGSPVIIVLPSATTPVDVTFAWPTRIGGRKGFLLPSMVIRGMWLASGTLTAYRTLRHYHANPHHRTELATEAARRRIEPARFMPR